MNTRYILGIAPGPIVGAALLGIGGNERPTVEAAEITAAGLSALMDDWHAAHPLSAVATERFILGPRTVRSGTPRRGGARPREVLAALSFWTKAASVTFAERDVTAVRLWATDARLSAAGLLEPTEGLLLARDAARHALYCAARVYEQPDPVVRRSTATRVAA